MRSDGGRHYPVLGFSRTFDHSGVELLHQLRASKAVVSGKSPRPLGLLIGSQLLVVGLVLLDPYRPGRGLRLTLAMAWPLMAIAAVARLTVVGYSVEAASTIGAMTVGHIIVGTGLRPGFAFLGCTDDDLMVVKQAMIRLGGGLVGVLGSVLIVGFTA